MFIILVCYINILQSLLFLLSWIQTGHEALDLIIFILLVCYKNLLLYALSWIQTDHEAQRRHNAELVKMQEESSIRKEQARRATEEQMQIQQRQTEKERAEIERETIRVKAMAEAEGRAHEAKLTEDHNRRMLLERINGEREKWLAAINTTFSHIEGLYWPNFL